MGVFPNLAVSSEAGTWHAAEIPIIFNTAPSTPPATEAEISIGNYMRAAWATFAKDPVNGLSNYGWPKYDPSMDTLVRLAYDNITGPNLINPRRYDADCVFVNVSSTDTSNLSALPDLGASITPTGTVTGNATTAAATATTTGAGGSSTPSPTQTSGSGRFEVSVWVGIGALVVAWFL